MGDEAELVRRAAAGDRDAAGEIYDRYVPLVCAILLDATGSMAEANDLVQEVFLRALGGLNQLRDPHRLCAWLLGIARRHGIDYRRGAGQRRRRFVALGDNVPADTQPSSGDALDAVREAIRKLPERERLAIHIHYLSGQPAEVARRALGLSSSGFYKLLERARRGLRAQLLEMEASQ